MRHTDNFSSSTSNLSRARALLSGGLTRDPRAGDARVAVYADDVRQRLHPVCASWDDDEFEALVLQIARMKVRWTELDRAD